MDYRAERSVLAGLCGPKRPGVYRVPLTGHDIARREAIIDSDDVARVRGLHFHYSTGDGEQFGRVATFNPGGDTRLHSLIMGVSGMHVCVMHRNGDPLDCRKENLVVRTLSEKGAAKRKSKMLCGRPPTSRFKGVCLDKRRGKWIAQIKKDQVTRSLGRFSDEIAAAEKYDEAAQELFGEHARLNFPNGVDAYLESMHADEVVRQAA